MNKKEYISKLKKQVKKTAIQDIASLRMDVINDHGTYKALCPFHDDQSVGSFILGGRKNTFKCFACGETGDGLDLIQHFDGTNFMETLTQVSKELGYIDNDQAERLTSKEKTEWFSSDISTENYRPFEATESPELNMAEPDVLHQVFSVFSEGMSLSNESKLTDEHLAYLKETRQLSEKDIEKEGFFSFPQKAELGSFIKAFYMELYHRYNLTPDVLENVPGFYTVKNWKADAKKIGYPFAEEMPEIDVQLFDGEDGIGIPIKDTQGRIVGIQIRKDTGSLRYKWFSSAKANQKLACNLTGSGAPKDVVYPEDMKNRTLFITEGKFKAMALSKTFGSVVISIQGVSSWRGIEEMIPEIEEKVGYTFNHIIIAYDADMAYNDAVIKQTIALGETLDEMTDAKIHIAVWNSDLGKGIDDLINNGHGNKIGRIVFDSFKEKSEKMLKLYEENKDKKELKNYFTLNILNKVTN